MHVPLAHRRPTRLLLTLAFAALLGLGVLSAPALAVHDTGVFQLDGDARFQTQPFGPAATDDWNNVCHEVTVTKDTSSSIPDECTQTGVGDTTGAVAVSWTAEPDTSASIFTGGGSKDPIDISSWAWKDAGGLPDKDNLTHGFAARYSLPDDPVGGDTACPAGTHTTCELLVFGSDRFDNSGDAQQGFWFFQNRVTKSTTKSGGGFKFNGLHANGDILVISDFSNGGTTSTITVYVWDDTVSGNLRQLETSTAAKCANSLAAGDPFCGIVNPSNGTPTDWSFTDKSALHTYLNGEFYEGGVNLSLLPGNIANECFSSIASETRSSTSTTATLKDFVLGDFGNCSATVATQTSASSAVAPGTSVHDTATVTGSSSLITPTGTVTFYLCTFALGSTDSCDGTTGHVGTQLTPDGTLSHAAGDPLKVATADSPNVNTSGSPLAAGRYCFRAVYSGDTNYQGEVTHFDSTNECFTVKDTSAVTTAQDWLPNDTAVVTAGAGTALNGTVTFELHESNDCSGAAVSGQTYTPTLTDATTLADRTVKTSNTTYFVTADKTVSWKVTFASSDPLVTSPSSSTCEVTALDLTQ